MKIFRRIMFFLLLVFALTMAIGSINWKKAVKADDYSPVVSEDFESYTAESTYNTTKTYENWTFYYGCVSTNAKLTGSKSGQMRWYASATSNLPYAEYVFGAATSIDKIQFNYAVGNTNVHFDVKYSTDGTNYTTIESVTPAATSTTAYSKVLASSISVLKFRIAVNDTGTAPSSGNYTFRIDDVILSAVPSNDPAVSITGSVLNMMVGLDDETFTASHSNFSDPGSIVWSSSNTNVATVNASTGVVHAVAMGTTTITATVTDQSDGSISAFDSKTIKVFPSNAAPISIATALDICEFTATNNSPYRYTVQPVYIKSVTNSSNFVVTDNTNDITVYLYNHGKTAGDKVSINGALTTYNSTAEFTSTPTIINYYTVTFNSNGGSSVPSQSILSGGKVVEPADPTKLNSTFTGWQCNSVAWNFDTNTVTSDITLDATWSGLALEAFQDTLNTVKAYMSLFYSFSWSNLEPIDHLTGDLIGASSYGDWTNKTSVTDAVYAGNSTGANDHRIQIRSSSNSGIVTTTSGGTAKKVTVTWNNSTQADRTLEVYGSNSAYTSAAQLYNDNTKGTLLGTIVYGTSTELEITGNYAYLGLKSQNGAMYFDEIQIEWEDNTFDDHGYSNVDFRIKCAIDDNLADLIAAAGNLDGAVYGIEVSTSSKTVKYQSDNAKVQSEADKKYVVIDLGDVLNNPERLDEVFTVRAYVTYNGDSIYSTSTKVYSVVTMIQAYLDMNNASLTEAITPFKEELENQFGKSFS